MKTTTELLQQLNDMQSEHIKLLEERIDVLNAKLSSFENVIEIDKITIQTQEDTIKLYIDNLNSKSNV
tara:strand:+ start:1569 stop:1772 length:204 start_codon:yes stop_codon:yes gene_type:complete